MTSAAQIEANRRNARKSTGPRTAAGKAASALNALKHGLASPQLILFDETADEFEEFYEALREAHAPADAGEAALVERMAIAHWRLRRVWRAEAAAFNSEASATLHRRTRAKMESARAAQILKKGKTVDFEANRMAHAEITDEMVEREIAAAAPATLETLPIWPGRLAELSRHETALERQLHRLTLDLDRMQKARHRRILDQQADAKARAEHETRLSTARRKAEEQEHEAADARRSLEAELVGHPMADVIRQTNRIFADASGEDAKRSQSVSPSPPPGAERVG